MTSTHCKTLLGTNTKLIKGMKTYYQPELYFDDGTNIGWSLPEELYSFQVFDIEEPTFIDEYGDEIEEDE